MSNDWLALIFVLAGSLSLMAKRFMRYLRYLQQDDYHIQRFLDWVWGKRAFDRRGTIVVICTALAISWGLPIPLMSLLGASSLALIAWLEEDPRKKGKVLLKMTERAKRLYRTALSLFIAIEGLLIWLGWGKVDFLWASQLVIFQSTPFCLIGACALLSWDEKRRQKKFMDEAKAILANVSPFVIGITGSYGKTSTKETLGRILQASLGPTFWPSKGVNTPMGITREIRMHLRRGIRYAVMEMGAYQQGSIRRLCELTPPHAAIITCIGTAHLERFGSQEVIRLAKSELAQAVPYDGILICNGDNEGARHIAQEHAKKHTYLYGFDQKQGALDCWISYWQITDKGTVFRLHWQGHEYEGLSPLFGKPALANVAAAFTMACALGAQPEYVLAALHLLEPVDNRLQVVKEGKVTYVRDAYNSNPIGFASALEVMAALPGQRRILMTPGMIELGIEQEEQNKQVGSMAARVCDYAILVGQTNQKALQQGLLAGGMISQKMILCETRQQAFHQLKTLLQDGDIVLIENDLPDLYEAKETF